MIRRMQQKCLVYLERSLAFLPLRVPSSGSFIAEHMGWRWDFYINVPIGLASMIILMIALKETRSEHRPKIDYLGTLFLNYYNRFFNACARMGRQRLRLELMAGNQLVRHICCNRHFIHSR